MITKVASSGVLWTLGDSMSLLKPGMGGLTFQNQKGVV